MATPSLFRKKTRLSTSIWESRPSSLTQLLLFSLHFSVCRPMNVHVIPYMDCQRQPFQQTLHHPHAQLFWSSLGNLPLCWPGFHLRDWNKIKLRQFTNFKSCTWCYHTWNCDWSVWIICYCLLVFVFSWAAKKNWSDKLHYILWRLTWKRGVENGRSKDTSLDKGRGISDLSGLTVSYFQRLHASRSLYLFFHQVFLEYQFFAGRRVLELNASHLQHKMFQSRKEKW